jgi:glycosyltransferase involved in cell wall biosynthesis
VFVSLIICTIRREELLLPLLERLEQQTYSEFEVLLIDAGDRAGREPTPWASKVRTIRSQRGLALQRNVGLRASRGDVIGFLDDDVMVERDFVERIATIFQSLEMEGAGGLSGYDPIHYGAPVTLRWRFRSWLGSAPSLQPGDADHLGRNVPLAFLQPFRGLRQVGWLPGFCMFYRREAIGELLFEEGLGTYAGEDRDFSMAVGTRWKLVVCGDLMVEHHPDGEGRLAPAQWTWRIGYGLGRSFRKRARTLRDAFRIAMFMLSELLIDVAGIVRRLSPQAAQTALARQRGIIAGLRTDGK